MSENAVFICGCGWLGLPLAEALMQHHFTVSGSCRSEQKRQLLQQKGIHAHRFELGQALPAEIEHNTVLILNLPPGEYRNRPDLFSRLLLNLIDSARQQGCQRVLFISTTSVYGDTRGKVTELSPVRPLTASAKAHVRIEQAILKHGGTVLRLAGLIGPGRHPAKQLAGRKNIAGGANPVNLIHRTDVIETITSIIHQQVWGAVLHLAAAEHPSRVRFYTWAAKEAGLKAPEFEPDNGGNGKIVDATATLTRLGRELNYPSVFDMPVS